MSQHRRPLAPEVSTAELSAARDQGALVVDVREAEEHQAVRVPDVLLVPMSEIEDRWREIPGDRGRVYVICATGNRSLAAAAALRRAGVDAVSVAGGTKAWAEEGRPVETGAT